LLKNSFQYNENMRYMSTIKWRENVNFWYLYTFFYIE
jgi:hypothetical protein